MASFKIEGGHKLNGVITPQGAKNEALQIICAVLLTAEKVIINNIPDIIDVNKLIFILGELGVKIEKISSNSYSFQADNINLSYLESAKFKKDGSSLRGSIMIVGPLLARFGTGEVIALEGKGPNKKAEIKFGTVGKKKLLLQFAKLKVIG